VLVVGDIMLDEYIIGKVQRISPEAPVPVVDVAREDFRLGGAANVAHNMAELKGDVTLCGVVGRDLMGRRLRTLLRERGIATESLVVDPQRRTTVKTRIIAHAQQMVRYDREDRGEIGDATSERVLEIVERSLDRVKAVIISDYNKGVIRKDLVERIITLAREKGVFVAVDPKVPHFLWYQRASIVTPNTSEALAALGAAVEGRTGAIEEIAGKLRDLIQADAVLVTRGEEGMTLFTGGEAVHIPAVAREVYDVTGAGDTVISVLTLAVGAGATLAEAALIANHAAGHVVGKAGTTTVSLRTLRALLEE
jgi:D-beta-D-heptose 7-phosphate kinase/D-beta-D-heptose 1-phosphate adenosyltransferase